MKDTNDMNKELFDKIHAVLQGTPNRRGFYNTDPELEEVIWEGAKIIDFEERKTYYQEVVFPKIIDVAPWIFLWTPISIVAIDNRIEYQASPKSYVEVMKMRPAA